MHDDATDHLYGLDPTDFVLARNELVKRLRKEGDKAGAAEVAKLKRPSPAAWAVNQLARRRRGDLEEVVRLGEQLRAAQDLALAGGEPGDMRQAGRTRREAVSRLAGLAEALFGERGGGGAAHAGEVAATLDAASLDADAGATVIAGRLTEGLRPPSGFDGVVAPRPPSGFGVVDGVVAPRPAPDEAGDAEPSQPIAERPSAEAPAPAPAPAKPDERALRSRREAEEAVVEARRRWEERSAQARSAVERVAECRRAVGESEVDVARLEDELAGAQRRLREVVRDAEQAEDAASRAEDTTSKASRDLRVADQRLHEVTGER